MIFYSVGEVKVPQNMGLKVGLIDNFRKLLKTSVKYDTVVELHTLVKKNNNNSLPPI